MFTISGLDSSQKPLSIAWEVCGGDTVVDASGGLVTSGHQIWNESNK